MATKIKPGYIDDNAVGTAQIADNSITAAKIAAGVLTDQIAGISSSADATAIAIDSSENVGIGVALTDAPVRRLHVQTADDEVIRVESTDANAGIELKDNGSSTLPPLISAVSDDLLIYTGHASSRVNVAKFDNDGKTYVKEIAALDANLEIGNGDEKQVFDASGETIQFQTSDTERLRIAGNNLFLNGGTDARIQLGSGGAGANTVSNDTVHIRGDGDDMKLMTAADGNYIFENNGTQQLRINSTGIVGINVTPNTGHTNSSGSLQIKGSNDNYQAGNFNEGAMLSLDATNSEGRYASIRFTHNGGTEGFFGLVRRGSASDITDFVWQMYNGTANAYQEHMRLNDKGELGIGINSPKGKLHIKGASEDEGLVHETASMKSYRNVATSFTVTSASRYWHIKTNISNGENIMFVGHVEGYAYGASGHVVDVKRSGYMYQPTASVINTQTVNNGSGSATLNTYISGDGYLTFVCDFGGGYYSGGVFHIMFPAPAGYDKNFEVEAQVMNSTSTGHY